MQTSNDSRNILTECQISIDMETCKNSQTVEPKTTINQKKSIGRSK